MNARWPLSLLLAAVLAAGVALKILAVRTAEVDPTPPVIAAASAFLQRQGLTVLGTRSNLDLTLLGAERLPDCRLILANMAPQGWHGGVVRQMVESGDALFFVFEGAISREQPVIQARIRLYLSLLLRHLGIAAPFHPLLGVVADQECAADAYPWAELASVPLRSRAPP